MFSHRTSIPSHPHPERTAGQGPFGAVLLSSSVCREWWAWKTWEEKRGSREKRGRKRLQKYCDKKRKLFMIMEYNKKKKSVVAFVISFFIWCYYHCLFLRINISTVAFSLDVPLQGCCFLLLCCKLFDYFGCSHHSKWVLAYKKESAVLSQLVIPGLHFCPSLSVPKCSRRGIGNST